MDRNLHLRIERLTKVILEELHPRIDALDLAAKQSAWTAEANKLRDEDSDDLFWELEQVYKPIVEQLNELYLRARANAAAFNGLLRRAPPGRRPRVQRGNAVFGLLAPSSLPDWDDPRVTHPLRVREPNPLVVVSNALVAQAKAFEQKHALMHGPDWWAAKQLETEQAPSRIR